MMNIFGLTFIMPFIFIASIFTIVVWIWALIDCLKSEKETTEKLIWVIVIVFLNILGALLYFFLNNKVEMKGKSKKRLERSKEDRVLAGVCGGIAKYLNVDPTIIRLIWVVFSVFSIGTGLLLYLIGIIIMPEEKSGLEKKAKKESEDNKPEKKKGGTVLIVGIISLLVIFVLLIISAAIVFLVAINEYNDGGVSVSKQINIKDERVVNPELIAHNYIKNNEIFKNNLGGSLVCNGVEQINCNNSKRFNQVIMPDYSNDMCFNVKCKFDVDMPEIKGFIAELYIVNDEVKNVTFNEVRELDIKTYEDCVNAGYEVLYPDLVGGPLQCAVGDKAIDIISSQESICVDMCGDDICQEMVCMGQGCPCTETRVSCPQDCY
jgi:phage shock protein C